MIHISKTDRPIVARTLRAAASLIRKGWTRKRYAAGPDDLEREVMAADADRFCAIGAITRAALTSSATGSTHTCARALADCLDPERFTADPIGYVVSWNDAPEQTAAQVADAMAACADTIEPPATAP